MTDYAVSVATPDTYIQKLSPARCSQHHSSQINVWNPRRPTVTKKLEYWDRFQDHQFKKNNFYQNIYHFSLTVIFMHSTFFLNKWCLLGVNFWKINKWYAWLQFSEWFSGKWSYWFGFATSTDVTNSCNDFGQGLFTSRIISNKAVFFLLLSSSERMRTIFDSSLYFDFCSSAHTSSSDEIPLEFKKGITNWLSVRSRSHCELLSRMCSTNFTSHLEWRRNSLNCWNVIRMLYFSLRSAMHERWLRRTTSWLIPFLHKSPHFKASSSNLLKSRWTIDIKSRHWVGQAFAERGFNRF